MSDGKKLLFVVDTDWFFISHRLSLALAAKDQGYRVIIVATDTGKANIIRQSGLQFIDASLIRKGINPLKELLIIQELYQIYRQERPDIVHHVTLKIILGGSVAARLAGVNTVVNAVTGLGHFFIDPRRRWVVNFLFSPLFRMIRMLPNLHYIFQNTDDCNLFINRGWANKESSTLIKGSGVDLIEFSCLPEPGTEMIRVSCGTRLLRDKGIFEFAKAAEILKVRYPERVECVLAGRIITENPTSISGEQIDQWVNKGILTYQGFESNIYTFLGNCHINVLPSYREGLPRSLIEACAVGRPIVTTDVPGCRDVVSNGINGFLVPARDAEKLADAIGVLIENKALRLRMGQASRRRATEEFDLNKIIEDTLEVYRSISPLSWQRKAADRVC